MSDKTTSEVPIGIKPGERYTDAQGRTWELTDHSQWQEVCHASSYRSDQQGSPIREHL